MKNKSNTIFRQFRQLSVVLSLLLLNGCVSWFYTPGMSELEELCEKDGGVEVQKIVEVEGYYNDYWEDCAGCYDEIITNKYQFVEINKRKVSHGGVTFLGKDMGYWRIYRAEASDLACHSKLNQRLSLKKYRDYTEFYAAGNCIAAKKVYKLKSRYGYFSNTTVQTVNKTHGSTIDRFQTEIREMATGNIIGKRIDYSLNPWPKSALDYGRTVHCSTIGSFDMESYSSSIKRAMLKPRLTK